MKKFVLPLIAVAFLGACADGAGPESSESSSVSIKFGIAGSAASPSSMASHPDPIDGSNGDLDITAIWLIVEEFELEPVETADCDDDMGTDDCEDFEQRFLFINVPLDGELVTVATADIPIGSYDELEFEVDNVHVHDDDSEEDKELIRLLFEEIIPDAGFMDWPEKASMVVIGTFTPTGEASVPFQTFFEAEIEVELEFATPVVITGEETDPDIIVRLMPDRWFQRDDGTVLNLADLQDQLVEFELEIEDGFELEIEIDD